MATRSTSSRSIRRLRHYARGGLNTMVLTFKLSSGDSHIVEPPDLWTKRIDRKYLDRAPRIVSEANTDFFICPGARLGEKSGIGRQATMAKYTKQYDSREFSSLGRWADVPPGSYDPF